MQHHKRVDTFKCTLKAWLIFAPQWGISVALVIGSLFVWASLEDHECLIKELDSSQAGYWRLWWMKNAVFYCIAFVLQLALFFLMVLKKEDKCCEEAALISYFSLLVIFGAIHIADGSYARFSDAGDHCANDEVQTQGSILKWYLIINYCIVGAIIPVVGYWLKNNC